jgi:hypothetical protein
LSEFKEELIADVTDENGLTEKDRAFLDVLFDQCGGDVRRAMDEVGFPKNMPTSAITKRLAKHIRERSKDYLVSNTGKAVISLVGTLNDPTAPGVKNTLAAAQQILDRGGVFKEEAPQVIEHRNMFILPAKDEREEDE